MDDTTGQFLQLVARGRREQALHLVFEHVGTPLYRFCASYYPYDPEDVFQTVLETVLRRCDEFRGDASLTTWVFSIARKMMLMRRRNDGNRRRISSDNAVSIAAIVHAQRIDSPSPDAMERSDQRIDFERVARYLDSLPEVDRSIIELRYSADLDFGSIADIVDMNPGAVRMRLHRTLESLRDALAIQCPPQRGTK